MERSTKKHKKPLANPNTKLEAARLQRRWSVEVASNKIGISVNTFNRWERGLQVPQLETLDLLCRAFEMSPEELGFENVISVKRRTRPPGVPASSPSIQDENIQTQPKPILVPPDSAIASAPLSQRKIHIGEDANINVEQIRGNIEEVSRRQAMTFLITTPATIFELTPGKQSTLLHPEEVLALSKVNLPLCWELYFEGGFSELKQVLPGYLAQLSALTKSTSRYSPQAAALASQAHQLAYLLALQNQDFGTALKHTHNAARYGQQAKDSNLRVAAMVRQAYIYFCLKRSEQRVLMYEEAMRDSTECSPLIQGYLYAGLAEAYANRKDKEAALDLLQRAQDTFPEQPEDDPNFSYTHFRWLTLHNLAGLVHLHLGQARQAWSSFAKVDRALPEAAIVPHRVEVTVYQAATALALGEMEQSCTLLETAINGTIKLGSSLRYQEACGIYEQMQARWPQEAQVKALQDLFHKSYNQT